MIDLLTMTVQLIGRESDGIRICRVEGESLVTVIIPRSKLSEAKRLPGLEAMTIGYVRSHGDHETDNAAVPEAEINPYKEQRVQGPHNDMLFRMRVLGYDLDRTYEGPKAGAAVFHTRRNGVAARGRYDKETGRFTVLAGSQVALDKPVIKNRSAIAARDRLFGGATDRASLEDDPAFASPGAAALFRAGRQPERLGRVGRRRRRGLSDIYRKEEN